ncbi:hypothetical protein [Kitasatospora cathayae]|uniref:2TM domain-containing protein n=1 Tax=Kitasatospora cathayae TaxID=3004092 RepID=A0ABY7QGL5_9ACTN|nr:hypothetical protein [Kitasatospora sp. HUAS 3-15]WBP91920.1 hypothetical protein O1G21_26885 [Kitasatospora sp. HUAS 3-15]
MARTVRYAERHRRSRAQAAAHHNRQVAGVTAVLLLVVCLYSVTIGPDGWLWFGWAVLLLACVALFLTHP